MERLNKQSSLYFYQSTEERSVKQQLRHINRGVLFKNDRKEKDTQIDIINVINGIKAEVLVLQQ